MEHVAIDLGGRESQICVRAADGRILEERRVPTRSLPTLLGERSGSRVILETCAEAFAVADAAREAGHEVRIVPSMLVRSLGVGARKMKNDRRDAQALSQVSCRIDLPSVHLPSQKAREWKVRCGTRDALVKARTGLVNNVRGWLRGSIERLKKGCPETFPERVRTVCLARSGEVPLYIERQLEAIGHLNGLIASATKEIEELVEKDPVCRRLLSVPGVGPQTAARFAATLDTVERFTSAHQVESYLGLTPGEDSSSDRKRLTSITKAGSSRMRCLLVQAAWTAARTRPSEPMIQWFHRIADRRGRRIAVVALARKLAGILYAVWRDGSEYNALRSSRSDEPPPRVYRMP